MFEYKEEYKYPTCACLNVTDDCNLACVYCFVQQKPNFMTLDVAKQAIDYLVNNLNNKRKLDPNDDSIVNISFFGGEPTIMWEKIILPTVEYAESTYPGLVHFDITTNGTLLNAERIKYLKEHDISILLSIDGPKEVQDKNRPCKNGQGSFELLSKNIPLILENFPHTTFRSTISQYSCEHMFDSYLFAIQQGFSNIFFCPNVREKWSEENKNKLHEQINKIFTYFILSFMNGEQPIQCTAIDTAFQRILEHDLQVHYNEFNTLNPNRRKTRCGLGTTSIAISHNGDLFSCQEQNSRDTNEYFYIGNIYEGINEKLHYNILNDYDKPEELICENKKLCENCLLRQTCIDDMCPSVSYDMFNTFMIRPEVDCLMAQWMVENALIAMDILVNKEKNDTFKNYLNDLYFRYKKEVE